jgi:hypothetical protein
VSDEAIKKEIPDFSAKCIVDKVEATVGDIVLCTVEINHKPSIQASVTDLADKISGLKVIDSNTEEPREVDSLIRTTILYKLQADTAGSYIIPSLKVKFIDEAGNEDEITTDEIYIKVKSAIGHDEEFTDIIDIKPLAFIKVDYSDTIIIIVGVTALIALIALFIIYRIRRERDEVMVLIPAHELAFKELDKLKDSSLLSEGNVKAFHFKLSEIFRRYMEARYSFNAFESTTEEILPVLEKRPGVDEVLKGMAKTLLRTTDLVKFTDFILGDNESMMELSRAYKFVQQTMEKEEAPEDIKKKDSNDNNNVSMMIV